MKVLFIIAFILLLAVPAYASMFEITAEVIAPIEITRTLPSPVKANQPFDVNLNFSNLVDLELFNVSIKETIPAGYEIKKEKKISPVLLYVGDETGATIIYWNIDRLANQTNLSLEYSLSAPKSAGNYTFRAEAFGFDAFGNKYAASNVTVQEIKKPPLWKSILEFLGISS